MLLPLIRKGHVKNLDYRIAQRTSTKDYQKFFRSLRNKTEQQDPQLSSFAEVLVQGESPMRYYAYDLLTQAAGMQLPHITEEVYAQVKADLFRKTLEAEDQALIMEYGQRMSALNPTFTDFYMGRVTEMQRAGMKLDAAVVMHDGLAVHALIDYQCARAQSARPVQSDMPSISQEHIAKTRKVFARLLVTHPDFKESCAEVDRQLWCNDMRLAEMCKELFGEYGGAEASHEYYLWATAATERLPVIEQSVLDELVTEYTFKTILLGKPMLDARLRKLDTELPVYAQYVRETFKAGQTMSEMVPDVPAPELMLAGSLFVYDALSRQIALNKENKK